MRLAIQTLLVSLSLVPGLVRADSRASGPAPVLPPIKEVTVFKDGHAFVLHEGKVPTGEDGDVTLDYLPTPVLGTFWPYSADQHVRLGSVTAGSRNVDKETSVLEILDLLQANIGTEVQLTLSPLGSPAPESFTGTIVSVPTQIDRPTPAAAD